ncbi:hypothetical protein J6590_020231 [Homalodisca vitripennis]|nr:hypothetical protein J6590_020231 [Homalodisca vitripennis]
MPTECTNIAGLCEGWYTGMGGAQAHAHKAAGRERAKLVAGCDQKEQRALARVLFIVRWFTAFGLLLSLGGKVLPLVHRVYRFTVFTSVPARSYCQYHRRISSSHYTSLSKSWTPANVYVSGASFTVTAAMSGSRASPWSALTTPVDVAWTVSRCGCSPHPTVPPTHPPPGRGMVRYGAWWRTPPSSTAV